MKQIFSTTLLAIALGLTFNNASAAVIYNYIGSSSLIADAHCVPNATYTSCQGVSAGMDMGTLQASFSFDTAPAANLTDQAMTPDAWTVSANGMTLSNTSAGYHLEYEDFSSPVGFLLPAPVISDAILISTDSSGLIMAWQFVVRANGWTEGNSYPGSPFAAYEPLRIGSASDATRYYLEGGFEECGQLDWPDCGSGRPTETNPVFVPGTDTLQFAAASSAYRYGHADATSGTTGTWTATVVPMPAAAWLFISALGLLGLRRKR